MHPELARALGLSLAVFSLIGDQVLKIWAHASVNYYGVIPVFPGFNIVAIDNSGMAFGIAGGSAPWILILIGIVLAGCLFLWLLRTRSTIHAAGLGLAVGGALGNIADRLLLGAVRDYIDLYWSGLHWPSFNLADVAIVTGLALVVLFPEPTKGRLEAEQMHPS